MNIKSNKLNTNKLQKLLALTVIGLQNNTFAQSSYMGLGPQGQDVPSQIPNFFNSQPKFTDLAEIGKTPIKKDTKAIDGIINEAISDELKSSKDAVMVYRSNNPNLSPADTAKLNTIQKQYENAINGEEEVRTLGDRDSGKKSYANAVLYVWYDNYGKVVKNSDTYSIIPEKEVSRTYGYSLNALLFGGGITCAYYAWDSKEDENENPKSSRNLT